MAADSAQLVKAYNKLENDHKNELPQINDKVQQHISSLKAILSKSKN